jgi:uncharacterized protein YbjT (DUF2867 family)
MTSTDPGRQRLDCPLGCPDAGRTKGCRADPAGARPEKLSGHEPANAKVVIGDVMDRKLLAQIMQGHDVVYANLAGEVDTQTERILAAMQSKGVKRLIFVNSGHL